MSKTDSRYNGKRRHYFGERVLAVRSLKQASFLSPCTDWIVPTALTLTLSITPLCPSPHLQDTTTVTLLCSIHGYSSEDIQVTWETAQTVLKRETFQKNSGRFYTSSNLTLPLREWNKLQEYSCKVTQPETNKTNQMSLSRCTGRLHALSVFIVQKINVSYCCGPSSSYRARLVF